MGFGYCCIGIGPKCRYILRLCSVNNMSMQGGVVGGIFSSLNVLIGVMKWC